MTSIGRLLAILFLAMAPLAVMAGDTLLTLTGIGAPVEFDREKLEGMEKVTFKTTTIWTRGEQTFTGVPLSAFFETTGISSGRVRAMAINDYAIEIPVSDAVPDGPIIAYELNGEEMSVRNKGPLWIVYPYDSNPDYRSEVIYSRSIWQLDRIDVLR